MSIDKTEHSLVVRGHADDQEGCAGLSMACRILAALPGVKTVTLTRGQAAFVWEQTTPAIQAVLDSLDGRELLFAPDTEDVRVVTRVPAGYTLKWAEDADGSYTNVTLNQAGPYNPHLKLYDGEGNLLNLSQYYVVHDPTYAANSYSYASVTKMYDYSCYSITCSKNGADSLCGFAVYLASELGGSAGTDVSIGDTTFKGVQAVEYNDVEYATVSVDGTTYSFA